MKNNSILYILGLAMACLSVLNSCDSDTGLKGNGAITTSRKNVQEFTELDVKGIINVYLSQSDSPKAEVKTDENLQHIVDVKTINGTLYVNTDTDLDYNATRMDIYISVKDLTGIVLDGVTALYCTDTLLLTKLDVQKANTGSMSLRTSLEELKVISSGVGDMELHGKAVNVEIINAMVGDILAYGFKTLNMKLVHKGTGDAEIYVYDSLDVEIQGVGDVRCKGNPKEITKRSSGVGRLYIIE